MAMERDISVELDIGTTARSAVLADSAALAQVLSNPCPTPSSTTALVAASGSVIENNSTAS